VANADAERPAPTRAAAIVGWVALIVVVDQATKSWVVANLDDGHRIGVIGSFVELALARNSGAAFSRFQGMTPVLAIVAIAISVVLVRVVRRTSDRWTVIGLVLVLGGALGNLVDRFARSPGFLRGHVVDFVSVGSFPLFNVADSCITVGAILLAVRSLVLDRRGGEPAGAESDAGIATPSQEPS
jgi:signal peptidase II